MTALPPPVDGTRVALAFDAPGAPSCPVVSVGAVRPDPCPACGHPSDRHTVTGRCLACIVAPSTALVDLGPVPAALADLASRGNTTDTPTDCDGYAEGVGSEP